MIKTILILFILTVYIQTQAQEHVFRPGIIINFNGIHIEGDNDLFWDNTDGSIFGGGGVSFGAFVTYDSFKKLIGTLEIRYIRKGSIYDFKNSFGQRDFEELKLHYIEMPLLIGINGKIKNAETVLETGFGFSRLINSKILFDDLTERSRTPSTLGFKKYDISWIADLKFRIGKNKSFLLGGRFEYSIFSIHNYYNLHNMNYGIELNYYLFNNRLR